MKKLVILLFLFLGGVAFWGREQRVSASMGSHSSISFSESYHYMPSEAERENTPTKLAPTAATGTLPQTGEARHRRFELTGILYLLVSYIIKKNWKKECKNEIN